MIFKFIDLFNKNSKVKQTCWIMIMIMIISTLTQPFHSLTQLTQLLPNLLTYFLPATPIVRPPRPVVLVC